MERPDAYKGKEPFIFISYKHDDKQMKEGELYRFVSRLQQDGYRVWYDQGIEPGTHFDEEIALRVEECKIFLCFLSEEYFKSNWCSTEFDNAFELNKIIVPIFLQSDISVSRGKAFKMRPLHQIYKKSSEGLLDLVQEIYRTKGIELCCGKSSISEPDKGTVLDEIKDKYLADRVDEVEKNGKTEPSQSSVNLYNKGYMYELGKGIQKPDYEQARDWYLKSAEAGNDKAMNALGMLYYNGRLGQPNYMMAKEWFEKAAQVGNVDAMNGLGALYYNSKLGEADNELARFWCEKAAGRGSSAAMCNIGVLYENGRLGEPDYEQARFWYEKAAKMGNGIAMSSLGRLYENGKLGNPDYELARFWDEKAATCGDVAAMNNLGGMYYNGKLGNPNYELAKFWFEKAAKGGSAFAMNNMGVLYEHGKLGGSNYEEALNWYGKALENGRSEAMNDIQRLVNEGHISRERALKEIDK